MKYKYYVAILTTERKLVFVTSIDRKNKLARWKENEQALPMTLSAAKDLQFGLVCNFFNALVITAPETMEYWNE